MEKKPIEADYPAGRIVTESGRGGWVVMALVLAFLTAADVQVLGMILSVLVDLDGTKLATEELRESMLRHWWASRLFLGAFAVALAGALLPLGWALVHVGGQAIAGTFYPVVKVRLDASPKQPGASFAVEWTWRGLIGGFHAFRVALEARHLTRAKAGGWSRKRAFRTLVWGTAAMPGSGTATVRIPEDAASSASGEDNGLLWLVLLEAEPRWPWLPRLERAVPVIVADRRELGGEAAGGE